MCSREALNIAIWSAFSGPQRLPESDICAWILQARARNMVTDEGDVRTVRSCFCEGGSVAVLIYCDSSLLLSQ